MDIEISRPLSDYEHFFRSRTASGFYRNFQVTATYSQNLLENLDSLYLALRKTILESHILICNVNWDESLENYIYHPIPRATFGDLVVLKDSDKYISNGSINETFMKEVTEMEFDLETNKPLFKLILVGSHDLCAVFEHTIADGVVGNYFHETLLKNLDYVSREISTSKESIGLDTLIFDYESDTTLIKYSLPPPIDLFVPGFEEDYSDNNPAYYDKVKPQSFDKKWPGRFPSVKQNSIAFKHINFTPQETTSLLSKCKENKVTLTSFIKVVLAYTLQPIFGDDHYTTHKVAVALRRYMDKSLAPPQYQALFETPGYKILGTLAFTGFAENFPPIKEFSWDFVKSVNSHLAIGTTNKKVFNTMKPFLASCDKSTNNTQFFMSLLNNPRADAVKISNLGFIKFPPCGPWTITNIIFSQDMSGPAADFMLNVVSTLQGGLNLVLSYYDTSFEDSEFENFDPFILKLKENLLRLN